MTADSTTKAKKTGAVALLSSFTFWFVVCLLGANWLLETVKPLQYVKTRRFVPLEQNPLVSKFPQFFESKERSNLLVLGSSMPMEAIARYDARFSNSLNEKSLNEIRMYTGARYLEHLVKQKTGQPVKAFNLTCVACMASDAELILRRAIEANRVPQLVLFGIGPRDFIDNIAPAVGKSPVCELLNDRITLPEIIASFKNLGEATDLLMSQAVYVYKVRGDYRAALTSYACDVFQHPADLFEVAQAKKVKALEDATRCATEVSLASAQSANQAPKFTDLPEWKRRYAPANFKRYKAEKNSFNNMLALCKQKGIRLIVVNMPITDQNRELIPKDIYRLYQDEICKMPAQYGGEFIDLDGSKAFIPSDFYDSTHMNAVGGKKAQEMIVSSAQTLGL